MLAFAAFTPHPLISIPEIGREQASKIRQTTKAFRELARELYARKPETIIVISPHAGSSGNSFSINQHPVLVAEFSTYGDLTDRITFSNDVGFGYQIKESLETQIPIQLNDQPDLDYGMSVPLYHLTRDLDRKVIRVVPMGTGGADLREHYNFGTQINRNIHRTTKRLAVIASGDLSHGARKGSVVKYNPKAADFNKMVRSAIEAKNLKALMSVTDANRDAIHECGLKVLLLLLGIIDQRQFSPTILSYEAALGVGYLTANFELH